MPDITINLTDEQYAKIAALAGVGAIAAEVNERFAEFAFSSMYKFITGEAGYRSLTEQSIDFTEKLFSEVLGANTRPTYAKLYNDFNMPAGQASYIARVLNDKQTARWRLEAKASLMVKLNAKLAELQEVPPEQQDSWEVTMQFTKAEAAELKLLFAVVWEADTNLVPPKTKTSFGDIIHLQLYANTLVQIVESLN